MKEQTAFRREAKIIETSLIGIGANLLLVGFKTTVGLLSHSIAIVMDAVNNLTDALSSVITVIGTRLAIKPADKDHPYGHGRYEYVSAGLISMIVLYAGFTALIKSVGSILHPETPDYSGLTLLIVAAAVLVKIVLGLFVKRRGSELHSDSLVNSGQDALMDAVISTSTLAAAAVYLLFQVSLEAWLGAVISVIIIRSGVDMLRDTISKILGQRVEGELSREVKDTVCETEGVVGAYDLILNSYGPDRWMGSVHIEVPDTWTADKIDTVSREITERVARKNHVIMTAIGIYSQNSTDDAVKEMRTRITETVMAEEYVLQIHGFYCDTETKTVRFDAVIDFLAPDNKEVYQNVCQKVTALYPDYTFQILLDSDFSD